jgi:apolipoprotein N-acyltransferase
VLFLVLITTIGAWIGYANPIYQLPIAALFFPAGLVRIGFKANSGYSAFKYGWLGGTLAAIGCFYWMVIPVQYYGGLPWAVALPCPVLIAGYIGLYYAFFALFIFYAKDNLSTINLCLTGGLVWASLEILMGSLFSGFPWMNLASAFSPWPATIQLASIIGA